MSHSSFTVAASVGTYHHAFDRFADWLEPWISSHGAKVVFQHGSTRPITGAENHDMMPPDELLRLYREADAVVIQGGAGGVMDARKAGRIPIVIPRQPVADEVVDDHQVILGRQLASMGLVHIAESARELETLLDGMMSGAVPSRTESRRPTAGVSKAVKTLTTVTGRGRPSREPNGVPTVIGIGGTDAPIAGRTQHIPYVDTGREGHGWAPTDPTILVHEVLHQGMLGYLASFAVAWFLTLRLEVNEAAVVPLLAGVALWLGYSFAALPGYERARSFKPISRLTSFVGVGVIVALLLELSTRDELRPIIEIVLVSAAVLALSTAVHRIALRRTATILVGQDTTVHRLSQLWKGRRDVRIVATCGWRGPAELVPMTATNSLAELVPSVLGAVRRHRARSVVIASDRAMTTPALRHLAWALQRADVECLVITDIQDHIEYARPRLVGDQVALTMRPHNDHLMSLMLKSILDRSAALVGLLLLAPVMLAVALVVRLTSRGPAVFRQERTGRDGAPFTMLKFRTMVVDAEERLADLRVYNEGAGPLFKLSNDPRITPVGRFLRKSSLDELPQLINVLRGDMSLVGPRPALPSETAGYSEWMWRRLHVKPGITGLWQVSGRSQLTWEESIQVDLRYVNNWNFRLDLLILLRTFGAVMGRDGAL